MKRLRVLVLGPDCNPEKVSIAYVTYSHAAALAELHDVTLVIRENVEEPVRRANAPFRAIEVVRMPHIDRAFSWAFRKLLKSDSNSRVTTAFRLPVHLAFEWLAWRQLRSRILAGEFDVVLRVVPMAAVIPSPFAFFLREGPIPFVIGPLQGGLPWPSGFSQLKNEKEWIDNLRNLYRYLPFARSTYRDAKAIIVASSQTYAEFPKYRDKLFFVPEPGIARSLCSDDTRDLKCDKKLELLFAGGLVPRKACDLALRAAAPLLKSDLAHFTVVGDGPEQKRIEELVKSLGIEKEVEFCGWMKHRDVLDRMRSADVFVFPTLRDNGAGVVFEALACGCVPVVVDFGGAGDIVNSELGCKVPLTNESEIVAHMEKTLIDLANNRAVLGRLRKQGMSYARESLTWEAKATLTSQVLNWAAGRAPRPDLPPPKMLHLELNEVSRHELVVGEGCHSNAQQPPSMVAHR